MNEWKEFLGDTEEAARAAAARHFSVSEQQLDVRVVSASLGVAGLGARTLILATEREEGDAELTKIGVVVDRIVSLMTSGAPVRIRQSDRDELIHFDLGGPGIERLARRERGVLEALAHVVERVVEKTSGEPQRIRIDVAAGGRGGKGGGRREGRGDREGRGERRGGRGEGRERRDDRGERRGGRDRDRDRDRGDRGGRRRERGGRESQPDEAELERWTRQIAEEVRSSGQPRVLDAMSSRERWIVHNTVKDIDGVTSESVGENDDKRVRLTPED